MMRLSGGLPVPDVFHMMTGTVKLELCMCERHACATLHNDVTLLKERKTLMSACALSIEPNTPVCQLYMMLCT